MGRIAAPKRKPKRIVFCFDGTWNRLSTECPTNVVLISQLIKPVAENGTPQVVYYDEGIGTGVGWFRQRWDGAFGKGMLKIMREAYRFLIFNYEPGDQIFAFGFSRGAYTARSFIGFIRHAGIVDIASVTLIDEALRIYREAPTNESGQESEEGYAFRAKHCSGVCVSAADKKYRIQNVPGFEPQNAPLLEIRYLGVWDTVRALGLPDFIPGSGLFNSKYVFHNDYLTSKIKSARHAVAIDEMRPTFRATLFGREQVEKLNRRNERIGDPLPIHKQFYQEKWFPGVHGAVGGGGPLRGHSDGALEWILDGARQRGLELRDRRENLAYALRPDAFESLQNDPPKGFWRPKFGVVKALFGSPRKGPTSIMELSLPALRRWHAEPERLAEKKLWRPGALADVADQIDAWPYAKPTTGKWESDELEDYEVQPGDTLSALALARLGRADLWAEIYDINRDRIDNPDVLAVGLVIRLPKAVPSDAEDC